jgi:hypothetical protein
MNPGLLRSIEEAYEKAVLSELDRDGRDEQAVNPTAGEVDE